MKGSWELDLKEYKMKKKLCYLVLATVLTAMAISCQKDRLAIQSFKPKYLLKSMEWPALGQTATFSYNGNSTVRSVDYKTASTLTIRNYSYGAVGLTSISSSQSLAASTFQYEATTGLVAKMNRVINDGPTPRISQVLDFGYNAFSHLTSMRFFEVNAVGSNLNATTTYTYVSTLFSELLTIDRNGNKRLIRIDGYSDEVSFDPLWFLENEVTSLSPLYNYPVLKHLASRAKLPASFKVYRLENGQELLEKTYAITYTISNQKLLRQLSKITDHGTSITTDLEVIYHY